MHKSIDEPFVVKDRKNQADEWNPQNAVIVSAVGSHSDVFARLYRERHELDAESAGHKRLFNEKGKSYKIAYKAAVALAVRIKDLRLLEGFDGRADYIAFLAGKCLTLKEGRATGKVYTAIARLEVVNIPAWRGRWWTVNLAIPAELRVAGPDAPPFGVQTPDRLSRQCEDVARELARCGSPPGSPASRMFDGGGFAFSYDSGKLSEQPEPDSIPVVLAPHEDTIKDYIQRVESSADHSVDYWDALKKAAAMLLRSQQPLGEALSDWKARERDGQTKRPDGREFARSAANALRNSVVNETVEVLELRGDSPTRNNASAPNSACDAVAEVFGLSYKTIETVWGDARRRHEQTKTPS